ncbi:subclass B3 metallo-beta-lactamase [Novosphingobium sp.]|uniref:subclass B3 metallo-beta-lactamase n=1 Tax=Novosphingobium sp. TaxID=1874826 RepID=UPI0025F80BAC|nr:subclass B3 metallo-beta-lactamase [Novosphingobium sp.]
MSAKPILAALALTVAACSAITGPVDAGPAAVLPGPQANAHYTPAALAAACQGKDGWADPAPPAHIYGNTWYVGTCGITALLVTGPQGHVLVDAGVPEAAPLVAANVEKLGFALRDVRWIVGGHEHFDHAGGIGEMQRLTGARVAGIAPWAKVMATGLPDDSDPQYDDLVKHPMERVKTDRILASGAKIALGGTLLTATATPAHSPGSTSWTWKTCEGQECRTITYADSISTISSENYWFSLHQDRVAAVRVGLDRVAKLDCGILLTPHPSASDLFARMSAGLAPAPTACAAYAQAASQRFAERLAKDEKLKAATQQTIFEAIGAAEKAKKNR